jgi:putative ABC transport system permease protein
MVADAGLVVCGVPLSQLLHLLLGVVAMLTATALVLRAGAVPLRWAPVLAVARGAVQLAVVGLLLRGVLTQPLAVGVALAVMLGTAARTASRRVSVFEQASRRVLVACTCGALLSLSLVFALGVLPFAPRYLVALGGIVIGGTMTGATLTGRRLRDGLVARKDEVEAWLALGATMRHAVRDIARNAAGEALVPALDQTRTTGLVTLPGAFIGALLGGADPVQASRFQLVVLASLICAQSAVAVLLAHLLGNPRRLLDA